MTAVKKDDAVDVMEKTSPKMSATVSPTLQQSCILGDRHLQVLLMFLGMTIGYSLRIAMSMAIVPMANAKTANPDIEDFGWDQAQKNLVLSSFFWGYVVTQVPSGYIANVWSGQKLLAIGMLLCGVLNVVMPFVASKWALPAVLVCRVGMGLTQACLLPCIHTLLSKWAPPSERARLGTFAYAGAQFGTLIAMPVSGFLAASSLGWPSIFYIFGTLAIVWSIVFFYFGANSPAEHRSISPKERKYIEDSLKTIETNDENKSKKLRTPWREMFTSAPVLALGVAHCSQNWGYWTLLTEMPSYMTSVMKNIEMSGVYSALPYLVMWLLSFPMSWFSDYALKKGMSKGTVRKTSNTVAFWGPAVALAFMSLVPTDDYIWAIVIFTIAVGLNAGSLCGYQINHIDLSPNFAGTMMSVTNCVATITAIIAPLIVGIIVTDESNVYQWNIVFYIAAAIFFLGNLIFVIFGKGEIQWWNNFEEVQALRKKKDKDVEDYI
ncbi:Putative inorganic phosphate cotransporter [Camponotus floridanus]|uniref:Putative inorganic phosphate cotransporter n=1 Tax=Camponotus floridanus TaxID=104421 RepID=E2AE42_CAMFO|nr:putative inorganic phosphate cotransporter [Camponotus floridanus]EFN68275.1 Putative inorganic phosphate cotransporter [Camponotus floridanus]